MFDRFVLAGLSDEEAAHARAASAEARAAVEQALAQIRAVVADREGKERLRQEIERVSDG